MNLCNGNYARVKISVQPSDEGCPCFKTPKAFNAASLFPGGFCPVAWHTLFPYWLTYHLGGNLGWFRGEKAMVQCPNKEPWVAFNVLSPRGTKKVNLTVLDTKGICPSGITPDNKFNFDETTDSDFCPHALSAIFPTVLAFAMSPSENIKQNLEPVSIKCPGCVSSDTSPTFVISE